jgi:hypothetical protein
MDDKQPNAAQNHREDSFDVAVRGYNRQQVLEYMSRSSQLLASLEQNLAVARADVQRARAEADRARAEAERLRAAPVESKPVHEEVSARLSQILRLAAEEADQERSKADAEISKLRDESQADAERMISEARERADRELAEARDTADRELAEARDTAEEELRAAHEEADRIRQSAEEQSTDLLDDAARRAGAINEASDQRLDTLTATHGEAVLRLGQIRDVLADLLDRDAAAGSLAQVVESVVAPTRRTRPEPEHEPEANADGADSDSADSADEAPEAETSVVPAVQETAVHEPVDAGVTRSGNTGPYNTVEMERVEDDLPENGEGSTKRADQEIDLRDRARADSAVN